MEKISELFDYMKNTKDDQIRYQLIDFMKSQYSILIQDCGSANPNNRYKLKLRRLFNEVKNLAEVISFCFENDIKMVLKELDTGKEHPREELKYDTIQSLAKKLIVSTGTIRNAMKSGDLKFIVIRGIGKQKKTKRFTPKQVDEYLQILKAG